jgi:N-methylhydantoinase A
LETSSPSGGSGRYRVGIDIGGTFTDFAVHDTVTGSLQHLKVPSVPSRPVDGIVHGLQVLARERNVALDQVEYFVHGTTIAVNALIERKGARLGMIVTRGFRDLLIIQRLRVPRPQYWYGSRPEPLIPRERIHEVDERLAADGSVISPLDQESLANAVRAAVSQGVEGLVLLFLHAYRNPAHERAARELVAAIAPDLYVCCSHEVWPQMREYERSIVTIVNAYVMPPVERYLGELDSRLQALGVRATPLITRSNGGVMTARRARSATAETLLSGPASGVMGAVRVCGLAGIHDFITLDVGGTSADVAIVEGGAPRTSLSEHVADFPIMMPVVGVSSIGAGGGSIAWVDSEGVLKVGPQSAGADPGPACYGKGQPRPTVTDAFLAAGLLDPANFAGGRIALDPSLAHRALETIAPALATDVAGAAHAILAMTVAGMHAELSNLAARRGIDPRDFALVSFGGAGGLLACWLAEESGIERVLVPQSPGTLCALGALSADLAGDFVRSVVLHLSDSLEPLEGALDALLAQADQWLRDESPMGADASSGAVRPQLSFSADMRYVGQSFEIEVPVEAEWVRTRDRAALERAFHECHERIYAHAQPGAAVEVVDLRLRVTGEAARPPLPAPASAEPGSLPSAAGSREVLSAQGGRQHWPVYRREALKGGHRFDGPAIVDQPDTTLQVPRGWQAFVHPSGSLLLERVPLDPSAERRRPGAGHTQQQGELTDRGDVR